MTKVAASARRPARKGEGAPQGFEIRCECGSLLARWTPTGLELKCRRCKRRVLVPFDGRGPPADGRVIGRNHSKRPEVAIAQSPETSEVCASAGLFFARSRL